MRGYRFFIVSCIVVFILVSFGPISAQGGGTTHVVAPGENLFRIALRYGVTVDALAAANHISNTAQIFAGQVLIIPAPDSPTPTPAPADSANVQPPPNQPPATDNGYYTVVPGDTLNRIARQFNVTTQALMTANSLPNPDYLMVGQRLVIPGLGAPVVPAAAVAPIAPASPSDQAAASNTASTVNTAKTHVVAPGETLAAISRQFNISWSAIAAYNNINDPNLIYVGMVLRIPDTDYSPSMGPSPDVIPAAPVATGKYILVVLHEQRVYIYQDGQMVRTVLVSTGVPAFPTVTGTYSIYVKYPAQTMYGPGYYLPGVPWVMYFYQGYSLHGTYWHHNWGHPMSHGCVNMPTPEAQWLYNFAEVGTPVQVRW